MNVLIYCLLRRAEDEKAGRGCNQEESKIQNLELIYCRRSRRSIQAGGKDIYCVPFHIQAALFFPLIVSTWKSAANCTSGKTCLISPWCAMMTQKGYLLMYGWTRSLCDGGHPSSGQGMVGDPVEREDQQRRGEMQVCGGLWSVISGKVSCAKAAAGRRQRKSPRPRSDRQLAYLPPPLPRLGPQMAARAGHSRCFCTTPPKKLSAGKTQFSAAVLIVCNFLLMWLQFLRGRNLCIIHNS